MTSPEPNGKHPLRRPAFGQPTPIHIESRDTPVGARPRRDSRPDMSGKLMTIQAHLDTTTVEVEVGEFDDSTEALRTFVSVLLAVGYARESVAKSLEEVSREHE